MKKTLFLFLLFAFCTNVYASVVEEQINENGFYLNELGVKISEENYNKIKDYYTEEEIINMPQVYYDMIDSSVGIVASDEMEVKTEYTVINDKVLVLSEEEVALDSIEDQASTVSSKVDTTYKCIETEYKRIKLIVYKYEDGSYRFVVDNYWRKMPKYRSYDVLAMRWNGGKVTRNSYFGYQIFKLNGSTDEVDYSSSSSSNFNVSSIGVGLSQNLVDDATYYSQALIVLADCSGTVTLYGTYQHVQSDISLATSKSYNIGGGGMGNVIIWKSSSVSKLYDNTDGLTLSITC